MRDSRIGSFGALGLGLVLAIQVTALADMPLAMACAGLILSQTFGRGAMTVALAQGRYLRAKGAGAGMDQPLGAGGMFVVMLASLGAWMVAQGLGLGYGAAATGFAVGLACAMLWRAAYIRRYGGDTGDLLGALHMFSATGVLLGVAAWP
jgi:adenosylcobinamide-GDP ribazoletransferase